ncbi:MAG: hypothetical protein M0T75_04550 [Chloroflexi bacterium]|nr:hypothetical protein [Chloroflexota bacterium]
MHDPSACRRGRRRRSPAAPGVLALVAALAAGCAGGGASPAAPSPSAASPSPLPSGAPAADGFVVRASWTQALPPRALFDRLPVLVVTADGRVLTPGAVVEIYPGPLVAPIVERTITPAGVGALVAMARDLGLLRADGDFTGGAAVPGGMSARLQVVVDGVTYELVGNADAPGACPPGAACAEPEPGTPAAFATFWGRLLALSAWLAPELGAEGPSAPRSYAIIVGPPPEAWPGAVPIVWPAIEPALDRFGSPVRGEAATRCGIAGGDLAAALRPLLGRATTLTPFVATPAASATHGLVVRPLLPGDEDPCAPLVE